MKKILFILLVLVASVAHATTWESTAAGAWGTSTNWLTGCCTNSVPNLGMNANNIANMNHDMTSGSISIGTTRGNLYIKSGATFTITGNLTLGGFGKVYVEAGGTLIVTGNVVMTTGSNVLSNAGTLNVSGSITAGSASAITFSSTTTVGGSISTTGAGTDFDVTGGTTTVTGDINLNGDGNAAINGVLNTTGSVSVNGSGGATVGGSGELNVGATLTIDNDGDIWGTGLVTWGTINANPNCSPALLTCSGTGESLDTQTSGSCPHSGTYASPPSGGVNLNTCTAICAAVVAGTIANGGTICEGLTRGLTSTAGGSGGDGATYTYQWETQFNSGGWGNASGTSTNATYTTAALAAGTHDFRRVVTSAACGSATTAEVEVIATANNTAETENQTKCIDVALVDITLATTGATGISNNNTTGANGLPAGVKSVWAGDVITISGTPTASGVFNYIIPMTGGCGSIDATGTITVTADMTAETENQTKCINVALDDITLATTLATGIANNNVTGANGLPAGVKAVWAGGVITISGTPTASGVFGYSILMTGGCGAVSATGTITVTADMTAETENQTKCINIALADINLATTGATGITGTDAANGLPTGVSATWNANTITITGTPSVAGVHPYSIPLTGGCGTVNATGTITVTADMTADAASSTPTLCINTLLTNITHTTTLATGISNDGVDAANGLPAGLSATWAGNTITISGTPTTTVGSPFGYSIPLTGACAAVNATGTITINAAVVPGSITGAQSICYNATPAAPATLASAADASAGTGGSYTYEWLKSTDNITWVTADGTSNLTTYSPPNLTVSTYFKRAVTSGACIDTTAKVLITVYADLTAGTIGTDQSISHGATPSTLTETVASVGGVAVYLYQWESSINAGSSWANAGGTDNAATYSPGALTTGTWYRRVITSGSSCGSQTSNTVIITVNMFVCSGSAPSNISSGSVASGANNGAITYQWESSTDGTTYNDIATETDVTLTGVAAITVNTWYRRKATIDGCVGYSNVLNTVISAGSPGGIATGLVVWLKADEGTGSLGAQWDDQSGNGNDYTTVAGPTVSTGDSSSNYNPYIQILSGGFDAPAGAALGANYTVIAVAEKLSSDQTGRIFDGHSGDKNFGFTTNVTTRQVQVLTSVNNGDANTLQVDIHEGANSADSPDSRVYELIIYNRVLSSSDITIMEAYLETKYGIVDGSNNYVTSTGASAYDISSYANDIIGLGKECYFTQKQSTSEDDSTKVFVNTAMAATNALNGGIITNSVSYLVLGNDGGRLLGTSVQAANIPPAGTDGYTVTSRLDRQWKVTNTNFTDDFYIEIEIENQASVTNLTDLCLIVDDDADFTSGANLHVYATGDNSLAFAFGSIIIGPIKPAIIPAGGVKFMALGSISPVTALPVELLSFKVGQKEDYNLISWATAAEINNSHFVVEKSTDGKNWETLETVQGAGNSSDQINYSVIDYELCIHKCYYRLNQVDIDGYNEYSDAVVVMSVGEGGTELSVYPVPVKENATIVFTASNTSMYKVEVFSTVGSLVYESKVVCAEGENVFDINTSSYAPGLYYLVMRGISGEIVNKVRFAK